MYPWKLVTVPCRVTIFMPGTSPTELAFKLQNDRYEIKLPVNVNWGVVKLYT